MKRKLVSTGLFLFLTLAANAFESPYYGYNTYTGQKTLTPKQRAFRAFNNLRNPLKQGSMTGYSTPISNDVFKQLGIQNSAPKTKYKLNSPTCSTDLFSSPSHNNSYGNSNGLNSNLGGGVGTKTGVTIIYD